MLPSSVFDKAYNPFLQALIVLALVLLIIVGGKLLAASHIITLDATFPWLTASSFMLFFALFNSVFSLAAKNLDGYWTKSMIGFVGLAIGGGLLAYLFSSLSIYEIGNYQAIYIVFTIVYLVFLSIMGMIKRIVEFAQHEEWQKPKKRHKK